MLGPAAHGGGENADIKLDTEGIYLHNLTWATLDYNGMYELYWFAKNIRGEDVGHGDLYHVYRAFRTFMADIPLGNGLYVNANATASHPSARVVGQLGPTNNRGHLWIQHADHTWRNVVDGVGITPVDTTIDVPGLAAPARYTVTWFDTYTGAATAHETLAVPPAGMLSLTVEDLTTDVAVKFDLATLLAPSDFDLDGDVDQEDFGHLQACLSGAGIPQTDPQCDDADLDGDEDVDQNDLGILRGCMSGANMPANPDCAN